MSNEDQVGDYKYTFNIIPKRRKYCRSNHPFEACCTASENKNLLTSNPNRIGSLFELTNLHNNEARVHEI